MHRVSPFRSRTINPSPSVFDAVRKTCYWCGPCSFPCAVGLIDADRAQKHGMDEFISANPCSFDHASLFEMVQRLTLDHRLNDTFCSLVSDKRNRIYRYTKINKQLLKGIIGPSCKPSRKEEGSVTVMCFNTIVGVCAGMVQSGTGVCPGWVLRPEWSARLSQTPGLPAGPPGESRTRGHYWPHSPSLQLCVLCLPCPWEQVGPDLSFRGLEQRLSPYYYHHCWESFPLSQIYVRILDIEIQSGLIQGSFFCLPSFWFSHIYVCLILCSINCSVWHVILFNLLCIATCFLVFYHFSLFLSLCLLLP